MTKESKKKQGFFKNKGFRFCFLFYLLVLFFLASLLLILLHFGLQAYERSQIDRPVKDFLLSLEDDDTLFSLLSEKLNIPDSVYESREKILREAYLPAFREGKVTFGPDYDEETDQGGATSDILPGTDETEKDEHVYAVYLNEKKIFDLSLLRRKNEAGFFMDSWELWDTKGFAEGFDIHPGSVTVMVPEGATLRIGGAEASAEGAKKGIRLCIFEKDGISADVYEIPGLYLSPEITVSDKTGQTIPCCAVDDPAATDESGKNKEKIYYYIQNENFYDYTFTVPQGVEVFLNDTLLTKSSCFSYESAEYPVDGEANRYGTPETIFYSARYFSEPPKIAANYAGVELQPLIEEDGAHYVFSYPEETLYSLRIEAPEGAQVLVGGVELPASQSQTSQMTAFGLSSYADKMEDPPTTQVYSLEGLLVKPEVEVLYNGKPLAKADDSGGNGDGGQTGFSLLYSYLGSPDPALENEQKEFIEKFVRAYINYVGMGKTSLDRNLDTLQSMILPSSAAYKLVSSSYAELIWVTKFSGMEYNYLRTFDYIPLSEDCYRCSAAFSVDISRSGVEKHFESEMSILVIRTKGRYKVVDFRFV